MNKVQLIASIYIAVVLTFAWGFAIGKYHVFPYKYFAETSNVPNVKKKPKTVISAVKDIADEVKSIKTGRPGKHISEKLMFSAGVKNSAEVLGEKNLLVNSWYNSVNAIRLMDADGKVIKDWNFDIKYTLPNDKDLETDDDTDFQSSMVFPNGDALANFEYHSLVKIDKCGNVLWRVPQTHHSISTTIRNTFWVPSFKDIQTNIKTLEAPIREDYALEIDQNGKVIRSIAMLDLIFRNNLQGLIINGGFEKEDAMDAFHLNDIEELTPEMAKAFSQFSPGDIMVSSRSANLIMVLNPNTLKVKWYQVGPWMHQHDPDFQPDGTITVFNNNSDDDDGLEYGGSNIMKIDPKTREVQIVYQDKNFFTNTRGTHTIMPNGDILITEAETGRVFLVNKDGKVIYEYMNKYDDKTYLKVTGATLIDKNYFKVNLECGK